MIDWQNDPQSLCPTLVSGRCTTGEGRKHHVRVVEYVPSQVLLEGEENKLAQTP